jgi:hypothetical protein
VLEELKYAEVFEELDKLPNKPKKKYHKIASNEK